MFAFLLGRIENNSWNLHRFTMENGGLNVALILLVIIQGVTCQLVRVNPEAVSYPGDTIILRCSFANTGDIQLTQVSWVWESKEGKRENIAVYHPTHGASYPSSPLKGRVNFIEDSLDSPSIRVTDVKMSDAGKYVCEYATYPNGNAQGTTSLIILAKPKNSATVVNVTAGTIPQVVARCESAGGNPEVQISWETNVGGNESTTSKLGNDNTFTVTSEYRLVPTHVDNGKSISCVMKHRTLKTPQIFPMKLAIEYPPKVFIEGESNWYKGLTNVVLTCRANGNPTPTVVWKTASGLIPSTVRTTGDKLTVLKVEEAVNTTFVCVAQNRLGLVEEKFTPELGERDVAVSNVGTIVGAILGVLLLLAIIAIAIVVIRKYQRHAENGEGPPKHKPPPPIKTAASTELNKCHERLDESQPLNYMYYETSGEPVTDLDANDDFDDLPNKKAGAPFGLDDSAEGFIDEAQNKSVPPISQNHLDLQEPDEGLEVQAPVSREDSFISPAMYV